MSIRVKPVADIGLMTPGQDYQQTHKAWGGYHSMAEIEAAMSSWDDAQVFRAEDVPVMGYTQIDALIGTEDEQDPVNGFSASYVSRYIPTIRYIDSPIDAFAANLQFASTQVDLRYFQPIGRFPEGWFDKSEFPTGGWPRMIQTKGVLPEGVDKPDRDTAYDGTYTGLQSTFRLSPNPQFALALWVLPNIRLKGMIPMTVVEFGSDSNQSYRMVIGGDNACQIYWRHNVATGGAWKALPTVKKSSIKSNSWASLNREGRLMMIEVWCVGPGIAVSSDRFQSMTLFRLPHSDPTEVSPWGSAYNVPASVVKITNNTGQFGIQWFEYRTPVAYSNNDKAWLRSMAVRAPYDTEAVRTGDPEATGDGGVPLQMVWKQLAYPLVPSGSQGVITGMTVPASGVLVGYLTDADLPALGVDEICWRAWFMAGRMQHVFTPQIGGFTQANMRNSSTANITYRSDRTPLLWSMAWGQKATVIAAPYTPTQLPGIDGNSFKTVKFSDGGSITESPVIEITGSNDDNQLTDIINTHEERRAFASGLWETHDGGEADRAPLGEGYTASWEAENPPMGRPAISAEFSSILSLIADKRVTGEWMGGEGWLWYNYMTYILEALGFHRSQFTPDLTEPYTTGLEEIAETTGLGDLARLNFGTPDKPLWYPESSQGIRNFIEDLLVYHGDSGLWAVPIEAGGEVITKVTTGCRWCHRHRDANAYDENQDPNPHYWVNHLHPGSNGCRSWDRERSGDAVDGVDYMCYTRGQLSTLAEDENLGYNIKNIQRSNIDIRTSYYNHVIVKGPSVRVGKSRDQISIQFRDKPSIDGQSGYPFALGYERTAPVFQRDWITTEAIAIRVGAAMYYRYTSVNDILAITIPYLPVARVGNTFSVYGGEGIGVDGWICRITKVEHNQESGTKFADKGESVLTGVKIDTVTA